MKKFIYLFIIFAVIAGGCARKPVLAPLKNSLPAEEVKLLWGSPKEIINIGVSSQNYPVEVWEYESNKGKDNWVLIFVDSELFFWEKNNPEKIFEQLINLGVYDRDEFKFIQEKSLENSVNQAEETRRTMEVIRTFQFYENVRMQTQTQQIINTIQRPQPHRPPPLPPAPPVKQPIRQ